MANENIKAGRAVVEVTTNNKPLEKGLADAAARLQGLGTTIAAVGAAIAGTGAAITTGLLAAVAKFAEAGDKILALSQRTGLSIKAVQELGYIATQSSTDVELLTLSISKMSLALAKTGQLQGLSQMEQFAAVADRIAKTSDPVARAALAIELFGKKGRELLPVLLGGAEQLEKWKKEAQDLGQVMSDEAVRAADDLSDAMEGLGKTFDGLINNIGAALGPGLTALVKEMTQAVGAVSVWVQKNALLVTGLAAVAAGMVIVGTAVVAIGATIATTGIALGALGSAIVGFTTAITLLNPVTAIILGVVVGAAELHATLLLVLSQIPAVQRAFSGLADEAARLSKAIAQDLAGSFDTLKTSFVVGNFEGLFDVMAKVAQLGMVRIGATMKTAWAETLEGMKILTTDFLLNESVQAIPVIGKQLKEAADSIKEASAGNLTKLAEENAGAIAAATAQLETAKALAEDRNEELSEVPPEPKPRGARFDKEGFDRKAREKRRKKLAGLDAAREIRESLIEAQITVEESLRSGLRKATDIAVKTFTPQKTVEHAASVGTFSAAAVGQIGPDRMQERIGKATEATAKNTAALLSKGIKFVFKGS